MDIRYKAFYACCMNDSAEVKAVPDNTPGQYAYRCIPLSAANTMGWEILNPVDVELSWTGFDNGDEIKVKSERDPFAPAPHFGSGTVTWYLPFPFTMNWRITTPNETIKFAAGEPICRVLPYPLELLNDMQIELHDMHEDPAFVQKVKGWEKQRQVDYRNQQKAEQEWAAQGKKPRMKDMWNSQYAKGLGSDDASVEHQTVFKCADVVDKRE
jgi:hypothetical protein